jgi:hypothetical protein
MYFTSTYVGRVASVAWGVLTLAWTSGAWAATYYVAAGGNGDGSSGSPWGAIQTAVTSTSPVQGGDTIVVRTGTYSLPSAVDFQKSGSAGNPITLRGETGVVLNVTASDTPSGALDLFNAHDWVIDGFRLNDASHYGIALHGCTNVTVQNCTIYCAQASAIIVEVSNWGSDDIYPVPQNWGIKILNNTFEQANWNQGDNEGVSLWATDGFEIAGNTLIDCQHEGIDVKTGSRNGSVHHNTVRGENNRYGGTGMGVYIDGWHYDTFNIDVYDNVVHDSEEGFEIQCEDCNKAGTSGSVHDVRIFNNVVYHNTDILGSGWKGRGMSFFGNTGSHPVHDVHVFNNTFVGSQMLGIHVDNPDIQNLFIRNNIIVNNGSADVQIDRATSVTVENNILSSAVSNSIGAALTANGNSVTDPLFGNATDNDYHLQSASPAIDKASGSDVATSDFDGKTRPIGAASDLGAFEYSTSAGSGGAGAIGGASAGGAAGSGGALVTGGASAGNDTSPSGGAAGSGGALETGGAAGGGDATIGSTPSTESSSGGTHDKGSCSCRVAGGRARGWLVTVVFGPAGIACRRRARPRARANG